MSGSGLGALAALALLVVGFGEAQARKAQVAAMADAALAGYDNAAAQQPLAKPGDGAALATAAVMTDLALRSAPTAQPFRLAGALDASRDLDCLAAAVYYEARGESAAGQAAVAQVVLNRTRHPAFPKTVCGVVYQGGRASCQFSFVCNGAMRRSKEPAAWARARAVATRALSGHVMAEVGMATNFHVARLGRVWGGRMIRVGQVGSHVFYRMGGRGGVRVTDEVVRASATTVDPSPAPATEALTVAANDASPASAAAKPAPEPVATAPAAPAPAAEDASKPAAATAS